MLNQLAKLAHNQARKSGFYEEDRTADIDGMLMNVVGEVAEAHAEWRADRPLNDIRRDEGKPEGFPIELADIVIRVLDMCEYLSIDIDAAVEEKMVYNTTRSYRHGGRRS